MLQVPAFKLPCHVLWERQCCLQVARFKLRGPDSAASDRAGDWHGAGGGTRWRRTAGSGGPHSSHWLLSPKTAPSSRPGPGAQVPVHCASQSWATPVVTVT
eukprot:2793477-Rhodomonas_salina.3